MKCPHLMSQLVGDGVYDRCELGGRLCPREYTNAECEEYDLWLKEHEQEEEIDHQYDVNENNKSKWRYHVRKNVV